MKVDESGYEYLSFEDYERIYRIIWKHSELKLDYVLELKTKERLEYLRTNNIRSYHQAKYDQYYLEIVQETTQEEEKIRKDYYEKVLLKLDLQEDVL